MKRLNKQQKEEIIRKIREDKTLSDEYRFLIPFETEREYELTYAQKERKEDILADTLSVPFQPIKKFGETKEKEWYNKLIFGENLQALKHLLKLKNEGKLRNPDGKTGIKLIYIDPPFATKQEFRGSKGQKAYQDKLAGADFLEFLRKRLIFLKELLTDDGSIYLHLDWKKAHYVKILMDEIFGENHFKNEIIWYYSERQLPTAKKYNSKHETIFFYTKTENFVFNMTYKPYSEEYIKTFFNQVDKDGRSYQLTDAGSGKARYKRYLDECPGIAMDTVWNDIKMIGSISMAKERVGFPTQKPEHLLQRIIKASSNPGDIILDAFAGSGTTGAVAEKLDRRWIMIDSSKLAVYTIQKRMLNLKEGIGNKGKLLKPKSFVLYNAGLYQDSGFIERMEEEDYKKFVLELFNADPSNHKIRGLQMHGILDNRPVLIFSQKDFLTKDFVEDLYKTIGTALKDSMYIIVPQSAARFNEDYIDKGKTRYHILKIPYSIIQKILEKDFIRGRQPLSKEDVNQTIESVGFDFIYPPKVECEYYQSKEKTLFDNLVIKIKKFEPVQISKNPVEFKDPKKEALSMVMIDKDYNGKVFDMDYHFFGNEISENDFKVIFPKEKVDNEVMIIYLDILGNEKVEVKSIKDFKKK